MVQEKIKKDPEKAIHTNMNALASLLVNQVRSKNHWIAFKLVGTKSNRDGIGARITFRAGNRSYVDEVRSGSSYLSQSDMRVHFGLGDTEKIGEIEVRWPLGRVERFKDLKVDSFNTLKEGGGEVPAAPGKPAQ